MLELSCVLRSGATNNSQSRLDIDAAMNQTRNLCCSNGREGGGRNIEEEGKDTVESEVDIYSSVHLQCHSMPQYSATFK